MRWRDKTSPIRNVHILYSNCTLLKTTQTQSLFRHPPTTLSTKCWSSLSHSSTMRSRSLWTALTLVLYTHSCNVVCQRFHSPPRSRHDCFVATSLVGWNLCDSLAKLLTRRARAQLGIFSVYLQRIFKRSVSKNITADNKNFQWTQCCNFSLKLTNILKSYRKKTKVSQFYGTQCK